MVVLIPDSEGKHAAQVLDAIAPILLVQMDNGFGVGGGAIAVPTPLQVSPQVQVVVDFAIVGDPDCAILVAHRLVAGGGEVNDGQTAMAQADGAADPAPLIVRATVTQDTVHLADEGFIHGMSGVEVEFASDATHNLLLLKDKLVAPYRVRPDRISQDESPLLAEAYNFIERGVFIRKSASPIYCIIID